MRQLGPDHMGLGGYYERTGEPLTRLCVEK